MDIPTAANTLMDIAKEFELDVDSRPIGDLEGILDEGARKHELLATIIRSGYSAKSTLTQSTFIRPFLQELVQASADSTVQELAKR